MKKIYSILFSLFFASTLSAQITITLNELPDIGNSLWEVSDSTGSPALTGSLSGGANQTWNFAGGWQVGDTNKITFAAISTVSNTISSNFPTSTMVYDRVEDSVALFFTRNSSGLQISGNFLYGTMDVGSGVQVNNVATVFSSPEMLVPVPITYNHNQTYTSHSTTTVNANIPPIGAVTLYQYQRKVKQMECIGYGSITTPSGTYTNSLMVKSTITSYDTTYTANSIIGPSVNTDTITYSTEYAWFTNDVDQVILMQIGADSAGLVLESASYTYKTSVANDPEYQALNAVKIYPVPTSGLVMIDLPSVLNACSVKIFTQDGKELTHYSKVLNGVSEMDLTGLSNGIYLVELSAGSFVRTGKITVAH